MNALSADELRTFCEWSIETQGGEGATTDCGENDFTVASVEDCAASAYCEACTLTVGRNEDCTEAMADDPCMAGGEACLSDMMDCLFSCMGG